jgi:hypothetical protein
MKKIFTPVGFVILVCAMSVGACAHKMTGEQTGGACSISDLQNLEKLTEAASPEKVPVLEKLELPGKHWQLKAVEFFNLSENLNLRLNVVFQEQKKHGV